MILSYTRTIILYAILIAVIRLMGKRQIGQMEPSEFVVTMLVANLAAIPMQDGAIPLLSGLIPILTVLGMELILSYLAMRSIRLRKLLCGKPVILIENGRVVQQNLRQCQGRESQGIEEVSACDHRFRRPSAGRKPGKGKKRRRLAPAGAARTQRHVGGHLFADGRRGKQRIFYPKGG